MSETQTQSAELAAKHESLPEEVMAGLVSGIAGHEGKALLVLAMQPNTTYGQGNLHGLLTDLPGAENLYIGNRANQMDYCKESLAPIGAVAKEEFSTTLRYGLTEFGELYGKALATTVLEIGAKRRVKLNSIFGSAQSVNEARAPYGRVLLIQYLLTSHEQVNFVDICANTGLNNDVIPKQLARLAQAGLVQFKGSDRRDAVTYHAVPEYMPSVFGREMSPLAEVATNFIAERGSVTLDEVKAHCFEKFPAESATKEARAKLAQKIASAMNQFAKSGRVKKQTPYAQTPGDLEFMSQVEFTSEQADFWYELLNALEVIRTGTPEELRAIAQRGAALLKDSAFVRDALERGYSRLERNGGVIGNLGTMVLDIVMNADDELTARQVRELLINKNQIVSQWGVYRVINQYVESGALVANKTGRVQSYSKATESHT